MHYGAVRRRPSVSLPFQCGTLVVRPSVRGFSSAINCDARSHGEVSRPASASNTCVVASVAACHAYWRERERASEQAALKLFFIWGTPQSTSLVALHTADVVHLPLAPVKAALAIT